MNRLWWDLFFRARVRREIKALGPWYQPIHLGAGVWTRPFTRETVGQWYNCERGDRKLNRFILPVLPFPLQDRSVLEIGANAAGNLLWCWRQGAKACVGIESEERYFEQARWVKDTMTYLLRRDLPLTMYLGPAEDTRPIRAYGRQYDICILSNVLYHIPAEHRVNVLRKVGEICQFVILQGNGILDTGKGDGYTSLTNLIAQSGLNLISIHREMHVRGLVVVARGEYGR